MQPLTQLQLDASHTAAGTIRALRECWVDGTNVAPVLTGSLSSLNGPGSALSWSLSVLLRASMQVALTAILWGCGTAVGEVPPYFLSYKAASAGRRNEAFQDIQQAVQEGTSGIYSPILCHGGVVLVLMKCMTAAQASLLAVTKRQRDVGWQPCATLHCLLHSRQAQQLQVAPCYQ